MSETVRIGVVAEGKTDRYVIEGAIKALLVSRPYSLTPLQPEDAASSSPFSTQRPGVWSGVYKWCREAVSRSTNLDNDIVFQSYDVIVLHLDADVAEKTYESGRILNPPDPNDL